MWTGFFFKNQGGKKDQIGGSFISVGTGPQICPSSPLSLLCLKTISYQTNTFKLKLHKFIPISALSLIFFCVAALSKTYSKVLLMNLVIIFIYIFIDL